MNLEVRVSISLLTQTIAAHKRGIPGRQGTVYRAEWLNESMLIKCAMVGTMTATVAICVLVSDVKSSETIHEGCPLTSWSMVQLFRASYGVA